MKFRQFFPLIFLLVAVAVHGQQFTSPGWFRAARPSSNLVQQIEFVSGAPQLSAGAGSFSIASAPEIAEAITPEIESLARGLENDPKRIFDHVHDRIRYVHYFGSKKGAQLTLLERSGNDFDQCALLVALLRAAGHTASYQFAAVYMPYEATNHRDFRHWVGLTKPNTNWNTTVSFVDELNYLRGFPYFNTLPGNTNDLIFHRVWVRLTLGGKNYLLDPAFKVHEPISGINLGTAMGLNTNALMTAAGGNNGFAYTFNLNYTSLHNKLRDYTTNFLAYLQSNHPNASVEEILGGNVAASSVGSPLSQGLPFSIVGGGWPTLNWDYIPTNFMTSLKVTVDGTTTNLFMPQLQGQKLALIFTASGVAELWLEDELLLQKQTSGPTSVAVAMHLNHPHGSWNTNNHTLVNGSLNDHAPPATLYQSTNASYVLSYAFEPDKTWLRQRQERLDSYRAAGLTSDSREVLTETLNVMGLSWMLQTKRIPDVIASQQDMLLQYHHRVGRIGQELGRGYYIDVSHQLSGIFPASGNQASDLARSDRIFDVEAYFGSAAEHALIEQMQSSNLVAASTVKMLQIANASSQRIYQAKSNTWYAPGNIRNFVTNYNLAAIDSLINAGYTLLLPENGSNLLAGVGSWRGHGIVVRGIVDGSYVMNMLISGGYNGGFAERPDSAASPGDVAQNGALEPGRLVPAEQQIGGDPVSMVDGSFLETKTDASIGPSDAPHGLRFTRFYSSGRRHHDIGLGHGWTHNYNIRVDEVSAPWAGLGDTTPAQMAAMIVATKSAFELYSQDVGPPKNWVVTALIANWGLGQLIKNAVSVTLGNDIIQFVKQPNGAFTPPANSTMTLIKTDSVYSYILEERNGNKFLFNSNGWATFISDRYARHIELFYDEDWKLWTITD